MAYGWGYFAVVPKPDPRLTHGPGKRKRKPRRKR